MTMNRHLLGFSPRRCLEWGEDKEGKVVLLRPKLGSGCLGRWMSLQLQNPFYRIRLDEVGTLVWQCCDGQTKLAEIVTRMRQRFGAQVEPVEERLFQFIGQLHRAKLIEIENGETKPRRWRHIGQTK